MTVRSRLAAVLRARRAQEDIARAEMARANAAVAAARGRVARRADALDEWGGPEGGHSASYLASIAAGQALAHALRDAMAMEQAAQDDAAVNREHLKHAARHRRSVEKLTERAEEAARKDELAAQQRVIDDLSNSRPYGGQA